MEIEERAPTSCVRPKGTLFEVATATRTGLRNTNADAALVDEDAGFFAVSDGIGDTLASGLVAQTALGAIREMFLEPWSSVQPTQRSVDEAKGRLYLGVLQAHRRIFAPWRAREERVGTTFACVVACGGAICVGHTGDSRVYLLRPNKGTMVRLTRDDTVFEEAIRLGAPPEDAAQRPDARKLTRALGVSQTVNINPFTRRWEPGDIAMVCTDGVSDQLAEHVIADIVLDSSDLSTAAQILVDRATEGVGVDNSTVVLVRRAR
jgi:protein phosphatase